jgi:hypothetical protein
MSEYELSGEEKSLVTWLVEANRSGKLDKRFRVLWVSGGGFIEGYDGSADELPQLLPDKLDALEEEGLLRCDRNVQTKTRISKSKKNPQTTEKPHEVSRRCTIQEEARQAVDNDFVKPEPEPAQPSVIHQTNNFYAEVNQSAIGPHSHVELTQNLDLASVRQRIDDEGGEYAEDLHELLNLAESASRDGKALEPGVLSEFNEAMQNRSWIVSPVVSLILGTLTQIAM